MRWEAHLTTPDKILSKIKPGMRIFLGTGAAEPRTLVKHLIETRTTNLQDLELIQLVSFSDALSPRELETQKFRLKTFASGWIASEAISAGRVDVIPCRFSRIPNLFESGKISIDVAIVQITPPDRSGNSSLGISLDAARQAMDQAKLVVGEVNTRIPRTFGDTFVHMSDFHMLLRATESPVYFKRWETDAVHHKIAAHLAGIIDDKSCIAFSIGPLFESLSEHLKTKQHLGIHTPIFTDALMDLVESGAVTNRYKGMFHGKSLTAYALGTPDLMAWLDQNPLVEFQPVDKVFDPLIIGKNKRFVSIFPARKVDLTGRIALHTAKGIIGASPSEVLDFFTGASLSEEGWTAFALPSRNRKGEPNIRISVDRFHNRFGLRESVDMIVTEYGIAHLSGLTVRERAQALIDIAHPDDRPTLVEQARFKRILYPDQIYVADGVHLYPSDISVTHNFKDDLEVRFRPIKPSDEEQMRRLFYRFSDQSVYSRYFSSVKSMPHARMQSYVNVDWMQIMSIVGLVGKPGQGRIIAEARYIRETARPFAELAFIVDEAYQSKGISTYLYNLLMDLAKQHGLQGFTAEVLFSNMAMMKVFRKGGLPIQANLEDGIYHLTIPFKES